jgi:hypothetical protein
VPDFDVDRDRINVFPVGDEYVFTHYFDRTDLFEALQEHYNGDAYRFEVPAAEFPAVEERLLEAYFEPVVIEDPEAYCVVKKQYTEHADILRDAVVSWERRGHLFFLMEDELSVWNALEAGAQRLEETEFVFGL